MDGISLGIGIAALFTSCIECFDYFKAASDLRRSYEILLVKLEIQQERLLVWGDVVDIGSNELDSVEKDQTLSGLTKRCLCTIRSLLQDTEKLKSKYGLCPITSSDKAIHRTSVSANALKRFRLRSRQTPQGPSALDKTRWAIHDAAKFETLITHLKDLIDGLIARVPAPMERQDQKVKDDIASMVDNISGLNLVKEACEESYPSWHDAASAALDASEMETVDGRLADERVAYYQSLGQGATESMNANGAATTAFGPNKEVFLDTKTKLFFILTEQCRKQGSGTPCDQMNLGDMSIRLKNTHSFLAPGSLQTGSAPGYSIAKRIHAEEFFPVDLAIYTEAQDVQRLRYLRDGDEPPRQFCPLQGLGGSFAEMLKAFDHEWLDHAIYHAGEDEIAQTPSPEDQLSQIIGHHHRDECTAAVVILGEADYCIRLVDAGPFPPIESGRFPREYQIFMLSQRDNTQHGGWRWEREYVGNYTAKAPIVSSRPPTSSSQDLEADKSSAESRKRPRSSD